MVFAPDSSGIGVETVEKTLPLFGYNRPGFAGVFTPFTEIGLVVGLEFWYRIVSG